MGSTKKRASSSPNAKPKPHEANGAVPKKMGSLSSIQATLKFTTRPSSSSTSSSTNGTMSKSQEDRKMMPPPAARSQANSSGSSALRPQDTAGASHSAASHGKGKGKAGPEAIVVDDDDDGLTYLGQTSTQDPYQMWADRYAPTTIAELAPGKQRLSRLKEWLTEAVWGNVTPDIQVHPSLNGERMRNNVRKYRRLLCLTGPAGSGKTTSLKVVAEQMGIDLVEWNETIEERSLGHGFDRESPISKLSAFLSRNSFAPLPLSQGSASSSSHRKPARPRVLLLSALPHLTHQPTKQAFQDALLAFCQSYTSSSTPLVIIHSSTGSNGRAEESWMDRDKGGNDSLGDLLGRQVKDGPWCSDIDFLPLAVTFITKALNRVLAKAVPDTQDHPPAAAIQLIALSCNGDLRSAVNSLQLLCSKSTKAKKRKRPSGDIGSGDAKFGRKGGPGKGSRGGKGMKVDVSDDIRAVLDAVSRKEESLNLFHALGKVFYNKRIDDPGVEKEDGELYATIRALPSPMPLPDHLKEFERSKSLVQMDSFLSTVPVDASSFALWIHQSFPSFCTEIEEVGAAFDDFCAADIMRTDEDISSMSLQWQASPQAIAYALNLTVRGAHMALPTPVPRANQKIIKPQFFESYRAEKQNLDLLNSGAAYLTKKAVASSIKLSALELDQLTDDPAWGGITQREVLATELLPMMMKIQRSANRPLLPSNLQPLELPPYATVFHGNIELRSGESMSQESVEGPLPADEDEQMGVGNTSVWVDDEEDVAMPEEDALAGDDIEDWD